MEESDNEGVMPYLFNAKELDEETGLYYYGARYLDPTSVGWLSVDPLFEKYVGMSPYGYCAGNPVRLVDVDGRDVYIFDENGVYSCKIEEPSEHKGFLMQRGGGYFFEFADPVHDPQSIDEKKITSIEIKSFEQIDNALWNSGVYDENNQGFRTRNNYALKQSSVSKGEGKMDYKFTANFNRGETPRVMNIDDFEQSDISDGTLYLTSTKSGIYAHNSFNFGNFLWGAGMAALGFSETVARTGAHVNNYFNDVEPGKLDSDDDQLSIKLGFEWILKKHTR